MLVVEARVSDTHEDLSTKETELTDAGDTCADDLERDVNRCHGNLYALCAMEAGVQFERGIKKKNRLVLFFLTHN